MKDFTIVTPKKQTQISLAIEDGGDGTQLASVPFSSDITCTPVNTWSTIQVESDGVAVSVGIPPHVCPSHLALVLSTTNTLLGLTVKESVGDASSSLLVSTEAALRGSRHHQTAQQAPAAAPASSPSSADGTIEPLPPQKSFIEKYWMHIAIFVVMMMLSGGNDKPADAAGTATPASQPSRQK
eukprot:CAMPEP_0170749370 /NCGR_PEP_ID=MMETSP0437-20130122/10359_1 /TAXON_ID=0 /ORGANISM="Sexangularia sp." /LENGTH=182 /DNA_ID=CAMNT_0011088289 /DNA_START=90 /DNA_END=638 /DNA_ORIENTATION=-